ncbi:MAG: excinuclease ABC subunit UvrC [Verrucomicrobiae bacterium]|nr:excinuclease ABC subunit UvrC [Verrucomicrobiae bacterium]
MESDSPSLKAKVQALPNKPGVYLMRDRLARVIYVGKARSLRHRVGSYFQASREMRADLKTRALIDSIRDLETIVVKNDAEAVLLEGKLIKEYKPKYNVDFRDDKRFLYAKINLNEPLPRFTTARIRKDDGATYFGPFAHSGPLRNTLAMIRKKFGLRACTPTTPDEKDYKHCLYHIIKHCSAPCIGLISHEAYRSRVESACDFLEGQADEMIGQLEADMKKAAGNLEFEKAAMLRNSMQDLQQTVKQRSRKFSRDLKLPTTIDPQKEMDELQRVVGLPTLPRIIEGFDISNISGTLSVASMVRFAEGLPDKNHYRHFRVKSVIGSDDFASIAEIVGRRYRRLLEESAPGKGAATPPHLDPLPRSGGEEILGKRGDQGKIPLSPAPGERPGEGEAFGKRDQKSRPVVSLPDVILIDGGKGQLSAATAVLHSLGLGAQPVFGLAKQQEEIFLPGRDESIKLPDDSPALHLIQRVRDEAHRFANTFHLAMRKKRIQESVLDEFKGIGDERKKKLLEQFGSVVRLRKASIAEIAAVPGFGEKLAAELKAFLELRC